MSKVIVRPAGRADIEAFSSVPNKPTLRAWVGESEGHIIGIGGFAFFKGRWYAFLDLTPEARKHKMTIMRTAKMVLLEAKCQGIRFLYAEASPWEPGAERWLASLGFTLDPRTSYFYRWSA